MLGCIPFSMGTLITHEHTYFLPLLTFYTILLNPCQCQCYSNSQDSYPLLTGPLQYSRNTYPVPTRPAIPKRRDNDPNVLLLASLPPNCTIVSVFFPLPFSFSSLGLVLSFFLPFPIPNFPKMLLARLRFNFSFWPSGPSSQKSLK